MRNLQIIAEMVYTGPQASAATTVHFWSFKNEQNEKNLSKTFSTRDQLSVRECFSAVIGQINPFTATHIKQIFWSNNRTAFAQCTPAATTKYIRISTFVVCGVSSRVLSQPWRWRRDSGDCCATKTWPLSLSKAWMSSWDKELSIDALGRKIGRSHEGL